MKYLKIMMWAACATLMLTSCSEDQTSFDTSKMPGKATISGKVVYNQGTTIAEGGKFSYDYVPAAKLVIYAEVPNSYYMDGAVGYTTYTAETDEEGNYSFSIPMGVKEATVTIRTQPFESTTTSVEIVDQKLETVTKQVIFKGSGEVKVKWHDLEVRNITLTSVDCDKSPESYKYTVPMEIKIGKNMEYLNPIKEIRSTITGAITGYSDASVEKVWTPAGNVDFVMTVGDMTLNGTTDANGICRLDIPVKEIPANVSYSIKPVSYTGSFTHYVSIQEIKILPSGHEVTVTNYTREELNGYYDANNDAFEGNVHYEFASFLQKVEAKGMLFHITPGSDAHGYTESGWYDSTLWLSEYLETKDNETYEY